MSLIMYSCEFVVLVWWGFLGELAICCACSLGYLSASSRAKALGGEEC